MQQSVIGEFDECLIYKCIKNMHGSIVADAFREKQARRYQLTVPESARDPALIMDRITFCMFQLFLMSR